MRPKDRFDSAVSAFPTVHCTQSLNVIKRPHGFSIAKHGAATAICRHTIHGDNGQSRHRTRRHAVQHSNLRRSPETWSSRENREHREVRQPGNVCQTGRSQPGTRSLRPSAGFRSIINHQPGVKPINPAEPLDWTLPRHTGKAAIQAGGPLTDRRPAPLSARVLSVCTAFPKMATSSTGTRHETTTKHEPTRPRLRHRASVKGQRPLHIHLHNHNNMTSLTNRCLAPRGQGRFGQ
jgi:hypothetical protein